MQTEKMEEKLKEIDFAANWYDTEIPNAIEERLADLTTICPNSQLLQDSDGDYYFSYGDNEDLEDEVRLYLNLTWYLVRLYECPQCDNKFVDVIDRVTENRFHENDVRFCGPCDYPKGVFMVEQITSGAEIEDLLTQGFEVSKGDLEILKRIYPNLEVTQDEK